MDKFRDPAAVANAFVDLVGRKRWKHRLAAIGEQANGGRRSGRALLQRHAIELTIENLRRRPIKLAAEHCMADICREAVRQAGAMSTHGRERLIVSLQAGVAENETLVPIFHVLRSALRQRARGFDVQFARLEDDAPFDLLLSRDGIEAELACDVISAEDGRGVNRGAWFRLADRIDPDLQTWLAAHPGRYLLKMTLPQGLQPSELGGDGAPCDPLATLHDRIRGMLSGKRRTENDAALVLRLDPLLLAAAQADELGLMSSLRREFGPEAHLSVTAAGTGVFVMAARAGREDDVAAAVRRRMAAIAPTRLTGTRPGILAMFVEDTDKTEWRGLRDRLELEGETRQFLTNPEARRVVAVTCTSRLELFGLPEPDAVADGELRFRNPAHPAAKTAALAPAVLSSV